MQASNSRKVFKDTFKIGIHLNQKMNVQFYSQVNDKEIQYPGAAYLNMIFVIRWKHTFFHRKKWDKKMQQNWPPCRFCCNTTMRAS